MTLTPPPGPVDWPRIDRALGECEGKSPAEIDAMTLPEIAVLCMRADDKGPAGGRAMSDAEIQAGVTRWLAMTPGERIEKARADRDG